MDHQINLVNIFNIEMQDTGWFPANYDGSSNSYTTLLILLDIL